MMLCPLFTMSCKMLMLLGVVKYSSGTPTYLISVEDKKAIQYL